jgi:hypothetical protein
MEKVEKTKGNSGKQKANPKVKPKNPPKKAVKPKKKDGRGGPRPGSGRPKHPEIPIPNSEEEREKLKLAIAKIEKDEGTTLWEELAKIAIGPGQRSTKLRALNICTQSLIGTVKISASKAELKSEHHEHQHIHKPVILPELYPKDMERDGMPFDLDVGPPPRKDN